MNQSTGRRTLLLTGSSGRLGTAIIELAQAQLDIIAMVHHSDLQVAENGSEVFEPKTRRFLNQTVRTIKCDLISQNQIMNSIEALTSLGHSINYVVNAAADTRFLGQTSDASAFAEQAREQFAINFFAPALICSALFHRQWKNIPVSEQEVSVLHVSSLSGVNVFQGCGQGFYAASKAALNMLAMHMASEYGKYGIRINALAPDSFPNNVNTEVVASNALRVLNSDATGQIFRIGG